MTDMPQPVDFDARPPMPVTEYEQSVKQVNVGYDLVMAITGCFLRALRQPELDLLVVGAGGGEEVARFLPENPGWRLTGVDPSRDMLALAQAKVERLGVCERSTLIQGRVADLPAEARFGAATCLFVLHFLPDDEKLTLLREIAARLRSGAPLLLAAGSRPDFGELSDDFLGAWQEYGESMDMPAERMAATIQRILAQPNTTTEEDYERLLREAGFTQVARYFSALSGMSAWLAR